MKSLKIALLAAGLALVAAPAVAQDAALGSNSDQFLDAVQKRDGDKAIQLLQDHPTIIDARDGKGDTALIIALRGADREWTGFLLNKGADPNLQGANGDTPLIAAARSGFDEAAGWLLGLGAKVDGTNRSGETPLIIAVQQRDAPLVKILLQAGADPDHTDSVAGYSARDYAIRDARAREILKMIETKKPKKVSTAAN
jgi:ankyrin repeat protein